MKKIISLIAALAMVSSLFVTVSYAAPASMTLVVNVTEADSDQITEYEDNVDTVPTGYTLYALTFSQTGLGDWENTNTATTTAQKKKPTGFLPAGMAIAMDFGTDMSNIYADADYFFIESNFEFGAAINGSQIVLTYGPWSSASAYPLNASGETTVAEGDPIAVLYVPASDTATGTFTDQTVFSMKQMSAGVTTESAEYSQIEANITFPASVVLGGAATTTYTYTFKNADGTADISSADIEEGATVTAPTAPTIAGKDFVGWATSVGGAVVTVDSTSKANTTYYAVYEDSAPAYDVIAVDTTEQAPKVVNGTEKTYTDYDNNPVPVTKGYAIARFKTDIDSTKSYQLHAEAASGSKDFDINFGLLEVAGIANFVAIIKGAPADTTMEIRATDK